MKDFAGIELQDGDAIVIDWENNFMVLAAEAHKDHVVAADPEILWPTFWRRAQVVDAETGEEITYVIRCDRITGELTRFWPLPVEHDPETDQPKQITETRKFKLVLR